MRRPQPCHAPGAARQCPPRHLITPSVKWGSWWCYPLKGLLGVKQARVSEARQGAPAHRTCLQSGLSPEVLSGVRVEGGGAGGLGFTWKGALEGEHGYPARAVYTGTDHAVGSRGRPPPSVCTVQGTAQRRSGGVKSGHHGLGGRAEGGQGRGELWRMLLL